MAHIAIEEGIPGILGPMMFRPETARPLRELAEVLLRGDNSLSSADRETIAAFVSSRNDCRFCQLSHSAAAAEHLGGAETHYALIDSVKSDFESANVSPKLKALLAIAGKVSRQYRESRDPKHQVHGQRQHRPLCCFYSPVGRTSSIPAQGPP